MLGVKFYLRVDFMLAACFGGHLAAVLSSWDLSLWFIVADGVTICPWFSWRLIQIRAR